jgi:hypothetical protein
MCRQLRTSALAVALLLPLFAACAGNSPPSLGLLTDARVVVGETLRVTLRASDPDGDRLRFRSSDLPLGASITPIGPSDALLVWSPLITDTAPGGRRHDLRVEVDDGYGGRADQGLGIVVFPAFGTPIFTTPAGAVLNLASASRFGLRVDVRDDDSTDVALTLVDGPAGARLSQDARKSAWFHWEPDATQRAVSVHRAIFRADDGAQRVEHVLTLVLLNAEPQAGCDGAPPEVSHGGLPDQFGVDRVSLTVEATDARSAVSQVLVQYTRDDVTATSTPALQTVALTRDPDDPARWSGAIPVGRLTGEGALIHYAIVATDDDDPRGFACDLAARLPKTGFFSVAAYPAGAPPSACINDAAEPDDAPSEALPAVIPGAGVLALPGRRLCPNDRDLVRLEARAGQVSQVTARWAAGLGEVTLAIVDADGRTLADGAATGAGGSAVSHTHVDAAPAFVEVRPAIPGLRLGYMLEVAIRDIPCADDAAEPDDDAATAPELASGATATGTLCPADADMRRLEVTAGELWRVALAFDHAAGDLDLELLGDDGATVLGRAASERSLEVLEFEAMAGGTLYARVVGAGLATNLWQLSVERLGADRCPEDALGDVHTPATAAALFDGVEEGLVTCREAADWFHVDLNGGETLSLLTVGVGVRLDLFDDVAGAARASAVADADGYAELTQTLPRGRYWYRVATDADRAGYELLQEVADPPGPCQPDRYDDLAGPVGLGDGVFRRLRLCSASARDRFAIELEPFARITALTNHLPGAGSRLTLLDPSGAPLATGDSWGDGVFLEHLVEIGGRHILEVGTDAGTARLVYDLAIFLD